MEKPGWGKMILSVKCYVLLLCHDHECFTQTPLSMVVWQGVTSAELPVWSTDRCHSAPACEIDGVYIYETWCRRVSVMNSHPAAVVFTQNDLIKPSSFFLRSFASLHVLRVLVFGTLFWSSFKFFFRPFAFVHLRLALCSPMDAASERPCSVTRQVNHSHILRDFMYFCRHYVWGMYIVISERISACVASQRVLRECSKSQQCDWRPCGRIRFAAALAGSIAEEKSCW